MLDGVSFSLWKYCWMRRDWVILNGLRVNVLKGWVRCIWIIKFIFEWKLVRCSSM